MNAKMKSSRARPKEALVQPFVKWAGGKRQLLSVIRPLIPKDFNIYFEPFLGGGAVLFNQQPQVAVVNDVNSDLINCYKVIRDSPDELLEVISRHPITSEYYYQIRAMDRSHKFEMLSRVEKAARLLYLNRTCYKGLRTVLYYLQHFAVLVPQTLTPICTASGLRNELVKLFPLVVSSLPHRFAMRKVWQTY